MPFRPAMIFLTWASSASLSERNRLANWSRFASMVTSTTSVAFAARRSKLAGNLISCAPSEPSAKQVINSNFDPHYSSSVTAFTVF